MNAMSYIKQLFETTSHEIVAEWPPTAHLKKTWKLGEPDMQDTVRDVRTNSLVTFSYGPLHTEVQVLYNQQIHN